jgi:hypothetical protein
MNEHLDNANDPQRANAEGRQNEDQLAAEDLAPILPDSDDAVTKLFKAEWDAGRAALAGWIFHPMVRPIIEAAREGTETFVAPIAHYLASGQGAVCALINSVLHMTWGTPNGRYGIDVLDSTTGWQVTPAVKEMLYSGLPAWLTIVAYRLANAGVPLDPDYKGDHLVVGQLLMLDVWSGEYDLLEDLNIAGPTIYHVHGQGTPFVRAERTDRATLNSSRVLSLLQKGHRGERPIGRPAYAHAGPRAEGRQARERKARLAALREVLEKHPGVELATLLGRWSSTSPSNPAYQYRSALAKQHGISWDKAREKKPSLRTLQRDYEDLCAEEPRAN